MSSKRKRGFFASVVGLLVIVGALASVVLTRSESGESDLERAREGKLGKLAMGGAEAAREGKFGGGNEGLSWDSYRLAARAYPANGVAVSWQQKARDTFEALGSASRGASPVGAGSWQPYGPTVPTEPGILNFSGAPYVPASRTPAMVISPTCSDSACRLWVGTSGGGIWRSDDPLSAKPSWTFLSSPFDLNAIGVVRFAPGKPAGQAMYVGTGEANTCSSGCELGVGIYKSDDGGDSWTKLPSACVSNAKFTCAQPGQDAFLGRAIAEIAVDPTNLSHIFVGSSRAAVRGLSHNIGGGGQNTLTPGANAWGLYESRDGGATFTEVWDGAGTPLGIHDIGFDPLDSRVVYASAAEVGIWRRCPNVATPACGGEVGAGERDFKQVFATSAPGEFTRTMFDLTVKDAKTRIYVGDANDGEPAPFDAFWRTDNANQPSATLLASQGAGGNAPSGNGKPFPTKYGGWQKLTSPSVGSPYYPTFEYCGPQCSYDNDIFTPKDPLLPDTVYVIGWFQYGEVPCYTKGVGCGNGLSNGRAVLYSTTAGDPDPRANNRTFTDMTYDAQNVDGNYCALAGISSCKFAFHSIHPDQHEILINPSKPTQFFESSDGGIVRASANQVDASELCNERNLSTDPKRTCMRMLSRIPAELRSINAGLLSLQYFGFGFNPSKPCDVIAGTQDNGTWRNKDCRGDVWPQTIYGDGGTAGFDVNQPNWQFNEFVFGFSDSNFRDGEPTKWVISSAPLVNSQERVAFYWPQLPDPNPPKFEGQPTHPIFSGLQHVWRSWAFGAGRPQKSVPQDTTPDIPYYEENCPEFTTFGGDPKCGDYQPLGGPQGTDQPGDLTGKAYGGDRIGGVISWMARNKADTGTLWALTTFGRVFVTHNANAVNPADVKWHRIDNPSSPTRFVSSVYPDPKNVRRAWISYSGYNAATPTTPGHVFQVEEGGSAPGSGVFQNLNVEGGTGAFPTPTNNGDLPVADIVRDDATGNFYAATDFGVLKGTPSGDTVSWTTTPGMPRLEVVQLTPVQSSRDACTANCTHTLYAVTHSQGIWKMDLG